MSRQQKHKMNTIPSAISEKGEPSAPKPAIDADS